MVAKMQACVTVSTRDPTEVPKEFDTSFAPTLKANRNAIINARQSIQNNSGDKGCNTSFSIIVD
jgi:hypothetical protein